MTVNEQEQKFRKFIQSDHLTDREDSIMQGHPVVALSPIDGEPWHITTDRMEDILHEQYPNLSATVHGERCVIFYDDPDVPTYG